MSKIALSTLGLTRKTYPANQISAGACSNARQFLLLPPHAVGSESESLLPEVGCPGRHADAEPEPGTVASSQSAQLCPHSRCRTALESPNSELLELKKEEF